MVHQLLSSVHTLLTDFITTFGSWGIFLAMILESACIPIPSEAVMLFGGFMVAKGSLNIWFVIIAGVIGNVFGSVIAFWVGKYGGRGFITKYGKFFLINHDHLAKSDHWFEKYGAWAVFFGRNLPVIRTFISLPAGIARMDFGKFIIYTLIGCIPWNVALAIAGLKLGQNWDAAQIYIKPLSYIVLLLILILVIRFLYKNFLKVGKRIK